MTCVVVWLRGFVGEEAVGVGWGARSLVPWVLLVLVRPGWCGWRGSAVGSESENDTAFLVLVGDVR